MGGGGWAGGGHPCPTSRRKHTKREFLALLRRHDTDVRLLLSVHTCKPRPETVCPWTACHTLRTNSFTVSLPPPRFPRARKSLIQRSTSSGCTWRGCWSAALTPECCSVSARTVKKTRTGIARFEHNVKNRGTDQRVYVDCGFRDGGSR